MAAKSGVGCFNHPPEEKIAKNIVNPAIYNVRVVINGGIEESKEITICKM